MNNLKSFFNRIEKILSDNDKTYRSYRDILNRILKIEDGEYKISIINGIVTIKTNQVIKNEILLNKNKILEEFRVRDRGIVDIR